MKLKYGQMSFGKKHKRITVLHLRKPTKGGLAGMIYSPLFKENIAVAVDEPLLETVEYDFACMGYSAGGIYPRLCLWKEFFYDFKRGSPEARTVVFHELGHYVHGDYSPDDFNFAEYEQRRKAAANRAAVLKTEAAADAFAIEYLGNNAVIAGLSMLQDRIRSMYCNEDYDTGDVDLSLKEIQTRIELAAKILL